MPASPPSVLICVVGPTAIGKTATAITIARALNCEILSADSRQFYQEMNIGTAVPSPEELATVPHHFIQHLSIKQNYTVGQFERDALVWLEQWYKQNDIAVMVGGSGLYVDAVVKGLDYFPEVLPEIRASLNKRLEEEGISSLKQQLAQLDPSYYAQVDQDNPHRLIRALEICLTTGKTYSSYLNKPKSPRPFKTIIIGLEAPRELVYSRINQRVDLMIEAGLVAEAQGLLPNKHLNALQTVGYRELFDYFEGRVDLETAIENIKMNTRRFAKRQGTWFRKNPNIHWIPYNMEAEELIPLLKQRVEESRL